MSYNSCPQCGEAISVDAINIREGVALCSACGELSRLSEVVSRTRPIAEILMQPPPGCWVAVWGQEIVAHATLRSFGSFLGTLFFALFWNGILSIFLLVAIAGLYANLIGPPPAWWPAPNMNQQPMTLGMTIFLCIFLIPFVAVGIMVANSAILSGAGRIQVVIGSDYGVVRTGIGFISWSRRFDPNTVRRVRLDVTSYQRDEQSSHVIFIDGESSMKFGSLLREDRREWLQAVLHELLQHADHHDRLAVLTTVS